MSSQHEHGHAHAHAHEEMQIPGKVKAFLAIALAVVVIADFFIHKHHVFFFFDWLPGFSAAFAVISSIQNNVISKGSGHAFLMKHEGYYGGAVEADIPEPEGRHHD